MPLVPDTKDWTWVLQRPCPECGFDASNLARTSVSDLIRQNAEAWRSILATEEQRLRRRPREDRWSALEYACHVRDVYRRYDERLQLMLTEDDPAFDNWNQDETAAQDRYNDQDPAQVVRDLQRAAETIANHVDALAADQWSRSGTRSDGVRFTVEALLRYMIHDPIHHVHDVAQGWGAGG